LSRFTLLWRVGMLAAWLVVTAVFARRGHRDATLGSALLVLASSARLGDALLGAPLLRWASLVPMAVGVVYFWRAFGRSRVAGRAV
jgi:hypothetical protein